MVQDRGLPQRFIVNQEPNQQANRPVRAATARQGMSMVRLAIFSQLRYADWTQWVLVCLILPMVLGILLGGGLVAMVRYPFIIMVVACLVSVAVMIVRSRINATQVPIASTVKGEVVATGGRR